MACGGRLRVYGTCCSVGRLPCAVTCRGALDCHENNAKTTQKIVKIAKNSRKNTKMVITLRSGRLFQKFLMLWKGESALHVAVVVGTLKAFTGMHLGKLAWCPVSGFIRQGLRLLWCQTSGATGGAQRSVGRE